MKENKMNNTKQPEFIGFHFMGDIIEHFNNPRQAYCVALNNGFSVTQAEVIQIEVEKKIKIDQAK